jgi:hypothetical protein
MGEIDQLMRALFLLALLLYLVPAVFRLGESRRWFQRGAIVTLGIASNCGGGERDMAHSLMRTRRPGNRLTYPLGSVSLSLRASKQLLRASILAKICRHG